MKGSREKTPPTGANSDKEIDELFKDKPKGLNFKKEHTDLTRFFKFGSEEAPDTGKRLVAKFIRILPADHNLEGIEMEEIDDETLKSKGIVIVPALSSLIQYFKEKQQNDKVVYLIELVGEKPVEKGTFYQFEISTAEI